MTIAFFTNFINHHQVHVADELYKLTGYKYYFVATMDVPEVFLKSGYPDLRDKPYLIKAYESKEQWNYALELARSVDVMMNCGAPLEFEKERLKLNKLTFEVHERWLKRGILNLLSPRLIKAQYYYHTRWYNKQFYHLNSSAFCTNDFDFLHSFKNRCFKWGYFTEVPDFNIEKKSTHLTTRILWVARMLPLKHPSMVVKLAKSLMAKGYDFEINMIGIGIEFNHVEQLIKQLGVGNNVHLLGNKPNKEVLGLMREHDIFLFTSDKQEGWGAVLNEAMSNGCVPVASHVIGSVPFLIENKKNGMIFKSEDDNSLLKNVEYLINNPNLRSQMSIRAYETLHNLWSPKNAALSFFNLAKSMLANEPSPAVEGPCSVASTLNLENLIDE